MNVTGLGAALFLVASFLGLVATLAPGAHALPCTLTVSYTANFLLSNYTKVSVSTIQNTLSSQGFTTANGFPSGYSWNNDFQTYNSNETSVTYMMQLIDEEFQFMDDTQQRARYDAIQVALASITQAYQGANPPATPSKVTMVGTFSCPSQSPSSSPTPSTTPTRSPTSSPTRSPTPSVSSTPTATPSSTPSRSVTPTPSVTPSISPSNSPSRSATPSISFSPTQSPTPSPTASATPSISVTPSISRSPSTTPSASQSPSSSPSNSPSPSTFPSLPSVTPLPTPSPSPSMPSPSPASNVTETCTIHVEGSFAVAQLEALPFFDQAIFVDELHSTLSASSLSLSFVSIVNATLYPLTPNKARFSTMVSVLKSESSGVASRLIGGVVGAADKAVGGGFDEAQVEVTSKRVWCWQPDPVVVRRCLQVSAKLESGLAFSRLGESNSTASLADELHAVLASGLASSGVVANVETITVQSLAAVPEEDPDTLQVAVRFVLVVDERNLSLMDPTVGFVMTRSLSALVEVEGEAPLFEVAFTITPCHTPF